MKIKCKNDAKSLIVGEKAQYNLRDFISIDDRCSYSDYHLKFEDNSLLKSSITKDKIII